MASSRYARDNIIRLGKQLATPTYITVIRNGVKSGAISSRRDILRGNERLEHIAFQEYGDSKYWWIIAAASGIGWAWQLPAGTEIFIPTNLQQILDLTS